MKKLASRKFWMMAAAFLGSISVSIAGFANASDVVVTVGVICAMLSAAIYAACEAWTDAEKLKMEADVEIAEMEIEEVKEDIKESTES